MSENSETSRDAVIEIQSNVRRIFELSAGFVEPRSLWITAKLGIGDLLAQGPRSVAELAEKTTVKTDALHRVLRVVESMGVVDEVSPGQWKLTALGQLLRSDHPQSMLGWVLMTGRAIYEAFAEIEHSLRTGESAFPKVHGKPMYEHFQATPEEAAAFNKAMLAYGGQSAGALRDEDFSGVKSVVDVGAGPGAVLLPILARTPGLKGVLFDLPHIVELAKKPVSASGVADRCALVGGSFFEEIPGGEVQILSSIIHNWPDEKALTILRNCRKSIATNGKLLLAEMVIPAGKEPHFGKQTDVVMLVAPGGIERTEAEYAALLKQAGFRLEQVRHTPYLMSVLEARPV